jgi:hypothetical protein
MAEMTDAEELFWTNLIYEWVGMLTVGRVAIASSCFQRLVTVFI